MKLLRISRAALRRAAVVLPLMVLACAAQAGTTVYVSPEGDDGNAGTAGSPKATIQAGVNAAGDGGTVMLMGGTYAGTGNAPVDLSAISGSIAIRALDGASPIVDCGQHQFLSIPNDALAGLTLAGLTIQNGAVTGRPGGAVEMGRGCAATFERCVFRNNSAARGPLYGMGGAVAIAVGYFNNTASTFTACRFYGNSSDEGGGAIFSYAPITLSGCVFEGNRSSTYGGAVVALRWLVAADCRFIGNIASEEGGALVEEVSSISSPPCTHTRCLFRGNQASTGSVLSAYAGNMSMTDCAIVANTCPDAPNADGGAVNVAGGINLTLRNCTIAGNTSNVADTDVRKRTGVVTSLGSALVVTNCIVRVHPGELAIFQSSPRSTTVTYSDIQGGYAGTGNIDVDPLLVNPPLNDYRLLPNSLCVDAGTSTAVNTGDTDLDGHPRIFGPAPDMGAYELFLSNVTDQLTVTRGAWTYDRSSGTYTQPLTLTNAGADITTPLYLVFANLTGGTMTGLRTRNLTPTGAPYQILSSNGLTHGSSLTVTVTIHATSGPIAYTPLVYTGNGTP